MNPITSEIQLKFMFTLNTNSVQCYFLEKKNQISVVRKIRRGSPIDANIEGGSFLFIN